MPKRLTTESFIAQAKTVHGDIYDYSNVCYTRSCNKIEIICKTHGVFTQTPNSHLSGRGCGICSDQRKTSSSITFINKSNHIHNNKYNYTNTSYSTESVKVCIECPIHGEFTQRPRNHLNGQGCPKCAISNQTLDTKSFISRCNYIHNNTYNYSNVNYTGIKCKVCIICAEHGEFWQRAESHIKGSGCPICNESKGERAIRKWLTDNNITHTQEYRFSDCVYKNTLPFDFYLPDHDIVIEYDGIQHFKPIDYFGGVVRLNETKHKDNIKTKYANDNSLNILRIPYTNYDKINTILNGVINV